MATKKTVKKVAVKSAVKEVKTAVKKAVKKVVKAAAKVAPKTVAIAAPKAATKKVVAKVAAKAAPKAAAKKAVKPVTISFFSPASGTLEVAGSFNNWDPAKGKMKKDKSGNWSIKLSLAAGEYQYKLVFDGASWEIDPNVAVVAGEHGDNNLIVV
jgi:1,4-alpha-glucan branching enzyme